MNGGKRPNKFIHVYTENIMQVGSFQKYPLSKVIHARLTLSINTKHMCFIISSALSERSQLSILRSFGKLPHYAFDFRRSVR